MFVVTLFCLPETLYFRRPESEFSSTPYRERSRTELLLFRNTHRSDRKLQLHDFLRPFLMMQYLCVLLPALYYMTAFGYGTVLFAATGSVIFKNEYGFTTAQTGLIISIPLLIGCLIGEANAGWFTDWLVYQRSKRRDGKRIPEPRLDALWFALLLPVGTIIHGVCVSHAETSSWVGPAFGMGISCFGLQVATTVTYAYCTDVCPFSLCTTSSNIATLWDGLSILSKIERLTSGEHQCYKPQSPEISSLLNLFRQIFSAVISFYA